jgi:hypothetical protein
MFMIKPATTIHRRSPYFSSFLISFFVSAWKFADAGAPEPKDELYGKSFGECYDHTHTLEAAAGKAWSHFLHSPLSLQRSNDMLLTHDAADKKNWLELVPAQPLQSMLPERTRSQLSMLVAHSTPLTLTDGSRS